RIRLAVADDGIGIKEEDLSRIFNRFYRADKSRTYAEGSGLGLGLSMVREIAALHKGEVSVKSAPGEGSTFTVVF
ncbi:MAG: sensor histidine kinase, partial [Lachnospiraceae bacterium]|nr:sensor histidine kinase [Lachnospiraceae bacterium]